MKLFSSYLFANLLSPCTRHQNDHVISSRCHLSILHVEETPPIFQMLSAKQGSPVNTNF